jgi:hypothetical protein
MPATLMCQPRITVATARWQVGLVCQLRWLAWSGSHFQPASPLSSRTSRRLPPEVTRDP